MRRSVFRSADDAQNLAWREGQLLAGRTVARRPAYDLVHFSNLLGRSLASP